MATRAPPNSSAGNADLIRLYLARVDLAVANITLEVPRLPTAAVGAGQEVVRCIAKTATFRDDSGDFTRLSEDAVRDIASLARVLDEVYEKVKHAASLRKFISTEKPDLKIRRYQKRVEEAMARLTPLIHPSTPAHAETSDPPVANPSLNSSLWNTQDPGPSPPAVPTWSKTIGPARSTLKVVAAVTPVIPVVGQFIQCGVDVCNGLIDMFDGMSQNNDKAEALSERVSQLSDSICVFQDKKKTYCTSEPLVTSLERFQTQCNSIKMEVESLKSQARLGKFIFSQDNAGTLGNLNSKIDEALKALSMYLQLNTEHVQRIQERDRLLDRLGDGYFGDFRHSKTEGHCFKDTRVEILGRADAWTNDESSPERVLWIKGQAGRGKSTIARTVMSTFASRGNELYAIFHFRRGNETLNTRVVSALARQVARGGDEQVREAILQAIRDHQDVSQSPIDDQFKWLIAEPLQNLGNEPPPILFVIDALDECADRDLIRTLLRSVQDHSASLPTTTKFLITSRPEHHIIRAFDELQWKSEDLDKDDLEGTAIQGDLRAYYKDRLQWIKGLEDRWKSADVVEKLVERSERLFQWANTVMKYIEDSPAPRVPLRKVIQDEIDIRGLDQLYTEILSQAFPSDWCENAASLSLLQHVLGSLALSPYPISLSILQYLWSDSTDPMNRSEEEEEIHGDVLACLSSMLIVPDLDFPGAEIGFMHTSVRDFLTRKMQETVGWCFVHPAVHHARLALICFNRMRRDLQPDICDFQDPSQTNHDVWELDDEHVSVGLEYCFLSWSAHLSGVVHGNSPDGCTIVHGLLDEFCQKQLLNWLEVLSLMGVSLEAITMAEQSRRWLAQKEDCAHEEGYNTSGLLHDILKFSLRFRDPISLSARHISRSVMTYCPRDTELWRLYGSTRGPAPHILRGPISRTWSNNVCVGRGHSGGILAVAFSPDGKMLASGSSDLTIRLWDPEFGTPIGEPLRGHHHHVNSLAFSGDGKILASGSSDCTIRLWDSRSGTPIGEPLKGHLDKVFSVAFSGDEKILASGSDDHTIRLWNSTSGEPVGEPLQGHAGTVYSLAFSCDRKTLASGSSDHTIRLWNAESGAAIGKPLEGHSDWVSSVAFSGDGKMLASGSFDGSTRLWNPELCMPIGEPFQCSPAAVYSVAFSSDGKMLASAADHVVILFRNPASGTLIAEPLKGRSNQIRSLAFSNDGMLLASGSDDRTVRLWNPEDGIPTEEPLHGHSGMVRDVAFSGDGKVFATASRDGVRLWSSESGTPIGEPLTGPSTRVDRVAFSTNGKMLAAGYFDHPIVIWNPESGQPIGEPLCGYSEFMTSIAFSGDGKMLASGYQNGVILLWNLERGMLIGMPPRVLLGDVSNVAFSGDGTALISESLDGRLTWNISQGGLLIHDGQPPKPLINSDIYLYDDNESDGWMGWVFRDGQPWFWMPEEFWMNTGAHRRIFFSGNRIVISHHNVHILDVSTIM